MAYGEFSESAKKVTVAVSKSKISIRDVAAAAGVSLQTVSNVLNSPDRVKPETQEKVLAAIKKLKYSPNLSARRLRTNKSSTVAIRMDSSATIENLQQGFLPGYIQDEFAYNVVRAAHNRQIKVVTYAASNLEEEIEMVKSYIDSNEMDGLILTSTKVGDPRIKFLYSNRIPYLTFGRPWGSEDMYSTKHPWVDVDGSKGTELATKMFWEQGSRNIGFIGWKPLPFDKKAPLSTGDDRFLGWKDSLSKLTNRPPIKQLSVFGEESIASGRKCLLELFRKNPDLEAVICASDTLALGAFLELQTMGHYTVRVCGFDNSPVSKEFGFSSVDQNLAQVASQAFEILMGENGNQIRHVNFQKESTQAHVLLKPKLIIR